MEWPSVQLRDVAEIMMGQSPPGDTYNDRGDGLPSFQGKADFDNIAANLTNYIKEFSGRARAIIEHFGFEGQIAKLDKADRLFLLVSKLCEIGLNRYSYTHTAPRPLAEIEGELKQIEHEIAVMLVEVTE